MTSRSPLDLWIADLDAGSSRRGEGRRGSGGGGLRTGDSGILTGDGGILTDWERARAGRLRMERDRRRYVAAHVLLREILSVEMDRDPDQIVLAREPEGKPYVVESDLQFNLSHSGPLLAVAISREGPVGLDVELVVEMTDMDAMVEEICDPEEGKSLPSRDGGKRLEAFYRIWTLKEAVLKGAGVGLSVDPTEVHLDLDASPRRLADPVPGALAGADWTLATLDIDPDGSWAPDRGVGAVALAGTEPVLRIRRWKDGAGR